MQNSKTVFVKSKLFLLWLISYISVLLVPITISIMLYIASDNVIKGEINKANHASMSQLQQVVDDNLRNIRETNINISWDQQVTSFMYAKQPLSLSYQYLMVEIVKNLKTQTAINRMIDFLYVYFINSDIVLSTMASNSPAEIYQFYHAANGFEYNEWIKRMNDIHAWDYMLMPRRISSGQFNDSIAFMQTIPIPIGKSDTLYGTVVSMIDRERLVKLLSSVKWVDGSVIFIMDKNNNIVASTSKVVLPDNFTYERLSKGGQLLNENISGDDVIVTHLNSTETDWEYVSIIPQSVFLRKARYVRNLTLVGIVLCLIIGGAAAYLLARKNYNPVRKILKTISSRAGIPFNQLTNEFDFINKSIELTVEQKDEISKKLESQNDILKSNFLVKLLKGTARDNIPLDKALSNYNIQFCSDYFAVLLIQIDDISQFYRNRSQAVPTDGVKLARSVIAYAVQDIAKESKVFISEIDEAIVCLINFNYDKGLEIEKLESINLKSREKIENEFKISFTGGLSDIHENIYGISQAYKEALEALEYKFVAGTGKTVSYRTIKETEKTSYNYKFNLELQQKFINYIKAGDIESAGKMMDGVIDNAVSQRSLPVAMAKCLMSAIVNTMINAVREVYTSCDNSFPEQTYHINKLLNCKTLEDMKYEMESILRNFGEYISAYKEEKSATLMQRIRQYVEENYKDTDLNVSKISFAFQMNPTYLSRSFREHTGDGLLNFINKVRLGKAKELLNNKNISINDIAEAIGYYNSNAFIRAFKKYEGITPGKYRKLN